MRENYPTCIAACIISPTRRPKPMRRRAKRAALPQRGASRRDHLHALLDRAASTCCARSRWPTRSTRRGRWSRPRRGAGRRRAVDVRVQLPPGARGHADAPVRRVRAARRRSGTSARCTCRTGSSTRSSRWCGGSRRDKAGSGALGDIGAHIIDLTQYVTGQRITGVSGADRDVRQDAAAAGRGERAVRLGRRRRRADRDGHRRRRRGVHRPARRRRARHVRGEPVRDRPQERAPRRDQRSSRLAGVRPGAAQRAGVLRRDRGPAPSRASPGSW